MSEALVIIADHLSMLTLVGAILALVAVMVHVVRRVYAFPARLLDGTPRFDRFPRSAMVFFALVAATILLDGLVVAHARSVVARALSAATTPRVLVNGQEPNDQAAVLAAVRSLESGLGHHSHPLDPIHIEIISSAGSVALEMGRDSERPDEYWVFMPRYWATKTLEIGRLTSTVFSRY